MCSPRTPSNRRLAQCHDPWTARPKYNNVYEKDYDFYQISGGDPNASLQREIKGHFRNLRPVATVKKGSVTPSESHHSFVISNTTARTPKSFISNDRDSQSVLSNAFRPRYASKNERELIKKHYTPGEVSGDLCDLNTRKNWTSFVNA